MGEWGEVTLEEISSDVSYGYTESAKKEKVGPKFLRITDIARGRLNWYDVPHCPISEENFEKYRLIPGDIVIARTGATTGANYIIKDGDPEDLVFASYLIRYRINHELADPFFVGHLLQSSIWNEYVEAIAGGSAQPGANAKLLGSFEFQLPPLSIQKSIASILSRLDDKIDLLHRQNKTLEQMAETLFKQWFVKEVNEDWKEGVLGELVDIDTGFAFKSKEYTTEGNLKVIRGKNVTIGSIRWGDDTRFWDYDTEGLERYLVNKWDIVIGMDGSRVGKNRSLVLEKDLPSILAQRVARLQATNKDFQPFIWAIIYSNEFEAYVDAIQTGTSIPHISQSQIADYEMLIPDEDTLAKFCGIVNDFWKKSEYNSNQIHILESLRDTLLPKLMNGTATIK